MSRFLLSQAAEWLNARLIGFDREITGVTSDSRTLTAGTLFVALRGPRFDGHDYAMAAATRGAVALLVDHELPVALPQLCVTDTRLALKQLAAEWRATRRGRVIALTGSNGKTTTKELIAAALATTGSVHATRGNLNNDIGVPLTLLAADDPEFLVVELGANHPGEIAALAALVRPDVALITQAGRAHLEGFGSLAGVAQAKGEIIDALSADGIFILNADDPWAAQWRERAAGRRIVSFGRYSAADVKVLAEETPQRLDADGFFSRYQLRTPRAAGALVLRLPGAHNLMNAIAAVAVCEALNVNPEPAWCNLANVQPTPGRLCLQMAVNGAQLIDDSYNANPDSVRAAIALLAELPGRRTLVLGDLGELGPTAALLHRELGQIARQAGLEQLWAVGTLSAEAVSAFGTGGRQFPDRASLTAALQMEIGSADRLLIKGSRSAGMEHVVRALSVHHS